MKTLEIQKNISLKSYNTFGLEVYADFFCHIFSTSQLLDVLHQTHFRDTPKLVLGGGSNLLLTKHFRGLVLRIEIGGISVLSEDDHHVLLKVGAGVIWHQVVLYAVERGWSGLENLSLIPGTVGAAPIQNIGAYGAELKDVFHTLEAVEISSGKTIVFNKEMCQFDYRNSIFKNQYKNQFIITSVVLRLNKKEVCNVNYGAIKSLLREKQLQPTPKNISDLVIEIRQQKLPDPKKVGNSGSFFKNPKIPKHQFETLKTNFPNIVGYLVSENIVKVSAGWLIERAGFKGKKIGNTGTYDKQALVLVNHGGATGMEILHLSEQIQVCVRQMFAIELEREVHLI